MGRRPIRNAMRKVKFISNGLKSGALDTNRTCDPPLRRGMLYPLSYEGILKNLKKTLTKKFLI
jgi:hypothetical protein